MFGGAFGNILWGFSMLLHMLIPVIIIILAVTLGMEIWDRSRKKEVSSSGNLHSTLKERYARGEITREEFFKMKEEATQV